MSSLQPGFAAPVLDAQASFRAVLEAMSRPGRIITLAAGAPAPAPLNAAAAAALLTLADAETPVWSDAGPAVAEWLGFHAGCAFTPRLDECFHFGSDLLDDAIGFGDGDGRCLVNISGVNPVEYIADVLDRIDKTADDNFVDLLPHRWKPPPKPARVTDFDA